MPDTLISPEVSRIRCPWCGSDPLYRDYHDREWGVPVDDDRRLFEMLVLEGAQAGLSWLTILKKRERYRLAFAGFAIDRVAAFTDADRQHLITDAGIVRNRLKIDSAIRNARGVLAIQEEFGSLAAYLWRFVDNRPLDNAWRTLAEIPARSGASDAMSRDLKQRGFNFVGSTICYALMQSVGMVNDHLVDCFRYEETREMGAARSAAWPNS
ncbi:MAG: DNA-3-methyladenine glycosylase I [Desulfoprunum sp.]|uniref:DNA-3-methyladenine glycosylase I n=1 Tax=Desulfoprunum sp. TaxID=2020866 RepID=UPI003C75A318